MNDDRLNHTGTVPEVAYEDEHVVRCKKAELLQQQGTEAWATACAVTLTAREVQRAWEAGKQALTGLLAGRILALRDHGKSFFAVVHDRTGSLQVYIKQSEVGEESFALFRRSIDVGDYIAAEGTSFETKTGEVTLAVTAWRLLAKCLHPLPEKFHGLTDVETKYRQRYLDLMVNASTRSRFIKRSAIVRMLRSYLDAHDYIEVETPMLHPIAGGAAAKPFITHHNALDDDFYLRIAPELYLKRLVVGGFERVYEINRNFRNEGVSTRHNPEFTMLEFYTAHQDYHQIMDFVEAMLKFVIEQACGSLTVAYADHTIDFSKPFARLSPKQAVLAYTGLGEEDLTPDAIDATLTHQGITGKHTASYEQKLFALFEVLAEKKLIQPTFIIDYPIELSPLSRRDEERPEIAARYELFIAGMELSNGYNELNDPFDQAERFKQQLQAHAAGDEEAHQFDADFIRSLEYGLPPTAGVGIGIDRLIMIATNTPSIKDVILFPTLKKLDR
jgi:lysyl-tRNA synthetase class 2